MTKTPPFFLVLVASFLLASDAFSQEGTPLAPPPTSITAPASDPKAASNAGATLSAGDDLRSCKHAKVVDGTVYTWDKLEKGTDQAWQAYMNGQYAQSVLVFAKLADIGHPVAQWLMGNVYFFGQGVPLDYATSLSWFEKAAQQGCFAAFAPTAQMYEDGKGTMVDIGKAYMWYNIAIAHLPQGDERKEMMERRENVASVMTPAQIEAAQKRSLQFKAELITPPDISELPDDFFK